MKYISKFHYITQDLEDKSHSFLAEQVCKGGGDWIQLRIKNPLLTNEEQKQIALKTQTVCKKCNAKLIVNDNVFLAKEINADGVHVGKQDMNPKEARKILGSDFIIGATANTFEDIKQLIKFGVDYIGLGPYCFTNTKEKLSPILGIDGYKKIIEQCRKTEINIPIIAIGGIKINDIPELLATGIYGIAVSSAITFADNIIDETKKFIKLSPLRQLKIRHNVTKKQYKE